MMLTSVTMAQDIPDHVSGEIFQKPDKAATFKGGLKKFYKYIDKNLRYPAAARRLGVEGVVQVEFIIETDGSIREESVRVTKGVYPPLDEEAVRLIRESPTWQPAMLDDKPILARINLPIRFDLG